VRYCSGSCRLKSVEKLIAVVLASPTASSAKAVASAVRNAKRAVSLLKKARQHYAEISDVATCVARLYYVGGPHTAIRQLHPEDEIKSRATAYARLVDARDLIDTLRDTP
jgi:hypothetical protein